MIDTLADLHVIDPDSAALGDFGKPGNYFERQVARWTRQYRDSQTDYLPEVERLIAFLPESVPAQSRTSIVHGDYASTMSCSTGRNPDRGPRLGAGDARRPSCRFLLPRDAVDDASGRWRRAWWSRSPGARHPSLDEIVERYSDRSGVPVSGKLDWYFAYNLFRLTGIVQGIKKRAGRDGVTCAGGGDGSSRSHAGAGGVELRGEGGRLARRDGDRHALGEVASIIVYSFARSISGSGSLPSLEAAGDFHAHVGRAAGLAAEVERDRDGQVRDLGPSARREPADRWRPRRQLTPVALRH